MKSIHDKHVSREDLKEYLRRDDYFGNYSKSEKEEILTNLDLLNSTVFNNSVYDNMVAVLKYNEFHRLWYANKLKPLKYYMITDYQTTIQYDNKVYFKDTSPIYTLIILASKENNVFSRAYIVQLPNYEIHYRPNKYYEGHTGNILYMRDTVNNNSAYYDYRNIGFPYGSMLSQTASHRRDELLKYSFESNGETFVKTFLKGGHDNIIDSHSLAIFMNYANNNKIQNSRAILYSTNTIKNNIVIGVNDQSYSHDVESPYYGTWNKGESIIDHSIIGSDIPSVIVPDTITVGDRSSSICVQYVDSDTKTLQTERASIN